MYARGFGGTILSGMLLSSSMFQGFALQMDITSINNLKELEMSGLGIQLPFSIESVKYLSYKLHFYSIIEDCMNDLVCSEMCRACCNKIYSGDK